MEAQNENIKSLIIDIREKVGKPVSNRVVVAAIESLGIRDIDTRTDYGMPSIYELADLVYYELTTSEEHKGAKNVKEREALANNPETITTSDYMAVKAKIFARYYSQGIFHLFPVLLQILAIIYFGYSLWTFVGFNNVQSTAVVLGVVVGLVSTGGFVQVIGRQASFYWNHADYVMTKRTVDYLLKIGSLSIFGVLGAIFVCNLFFHIYPYAFLFIVFTYALLIGLLVLLLAPLHTLDQRWVITVAITSGTVVAILLKTLTPMLVYFTHWIGISVAVLVAWIFLKVYFKRLLVEKKAKSNLEVKPALFLYHNYKYFLYGLSIYVFIFVDRMLAWSSDNNGPLPFIIYFEKNYELGMDFAILVFLLLAGVLEFAIASFSKFMDIGQKTVSATDVSKFGKDLYKMYWQHVGMLVFTGLAVFVLVYFMMFASWGYSGQFHETLSDVSVTVCYIGGLGYLFLGWGMLNSLYLFTLGQPDSPLRAIVLACIVNFGVGFVLSRFVAYEYSVVGLLVAGIVFMLMTSRAVAKFYKNLDYYYYAAY
ncbi:hypothetical protein HUK80_03305 [Flavobacterium sp. MAH-1]|uniref:Membrane protein involved in the export of O-antigen and teichoic acid n=1 Tax=Flavobacterium agri TaxID=2743471 RepID=A0A7Y8Y2B2_9FLAO|nr:hypothetical protein [Flavobacterium agri]NUY79910.1 hypothetical protein [Flavobacterium agri]NYA69935.1 hypothetical protein [Flavobacterium agri]